MTSGNNQGNQRRLFFGNGTKYEKSGPNIIFSQQRKNPLDIG